MATVKKSKRDTDDALKSDPLWRKPITLDDFDDDPLENLYRGREVEAESKTSEVRAPKTSKIDQKKAEPKVKTPRKQLPAQDSEAKPKPAKAEPIQVAQEQPLDSRSTLETHKFTESELKDALRIKSEAFQFTDIKEILRGKSFDIYAYLRHLAGDSGICKIKHLDLMLIVDVSRPTLFKQSDWLVRLSLIEKSNVPGDHLGTSYTVNRLENVLPVPETLVNQMLSYIDSLGQPSEQEPLL